MPSFAETLARQEERPEEFRAIQRDVARAFPPRTEAQQDATRRLARALGQRLRLYRAQARWEANMIETLLDVAPKIERVDADQTQHRASTVLDALSQHESVFQQTLNALCAVERALGGFLPAPARGAREFTLGVAKVRKELQRVERQAARNAEILNDEF